MGRHERDGEGQPQPESTSSGANLATELQLLHQEAAASAERSTAEALTARATALTARLEDLREDNPVVEGLMSNLDASLQRGRASGARVAAVHQYMDVNMQHESAPAWELVDALGVPRDHLSAINRGDYNRPDTVPHLTQSEIAAGASGRYVETETGAVYIDTAIAGVSLVAGGPGVTEAGRDGVQFTLQVNLTDREFAPAEATAANTPALGRAAEVREHHLAGVRTRHEALQLGLGPGAAVAVRRSEASGGHLDGGWTVADWEKPGNTADYPTQIRVVKPDAEQGELYRDVAPQQLATWTHEHTAAAPTAPLPRVESPQPPADTKGGGLMARIRDRMGGH